MEKRRNKKHEDNGRSVRNKGKWKIAIIFQLLLMVFIYYEVYVLFRYTTGKSVTEKQMAVYKYISSIINSSKEVENLERRWNC